MVCHFWQAGEHILDVGVGINAATPAAFDDGVNDGSTLTGIGIAHEKPVLFSESGWPNGIFHKVVVDLAPTVVQINTQRSPLAQCIINGEARQALWQMFSAALQPDEGTFDPF